MLYSAFTSSKGSLRKRPIIYYSEKKLRVLIHCEELPKLVEELLFWDMHVIPRHSTILVQTRSGLNGPMFSCREATNTQTGQTSTAYIECCASPLRYSQDSMEKVATLRTLR